jgi:hypothetical protein
VDGSLPRAREESVRPRRSVGRVGSDRRTQSDLSAVSRLGRPLNFTVRRHGSAHCQVHRDLPLRRDPYLCSAAAAHSHELQLLYLSSIRRALGVLQADFDHN